MPDSSEPLRVLFLCTANSARSQIAEALMARKGAGRFIAASAGVAPAEGIHPMTLSVLEEIGIDWSGRKPRNQEEVARDLWDIVITTCDKGRESCPSFPGGPVYAHWSVPDPVLRKNDLRQAFRETVQLISWRIDLMLAVKLGELTRDALAARLSESGTYPAAAPVAPPSAS